MATTGPSQIDAKVQESLRGTAFESSVLTPISGGSVNWTYAAKVLEPLDNGVTEVMVKHGELYMMTKPEFALTLIRCRIEAECFKCLSVSPFTVEAGAPNSKVTVRTPKYYHFDEVGANQILEFLPNGTTLKGYALKYYACPTPESLETEARQIGTSLGSWLRGFAQWSATHPQLRATAAENVEAKNIRHMVNFAWLKERVKEYPVILGDAGGVFEEVRRLVAEEMEDESKLQVIHGDFWTGNVLLPDTPLRDGGGGPLLVIDWEMAQLGVPNIDFGEMIAELYTIWLYRSIPAGLWIMEAFVDAYGVVAEDFAFRTAIQVGAHIVCVTSTVGWGGREQVEKAVEVGRDIIVHAWKKDRSWFVGGELACLFKRAV